MSEVYKSIEPELLKGYTHDEINSYGELIYGLGDDFLKEKNLQNQVFIDEGIFDIFLVDVLVDLMRLRDFHEIIHENGIKFRSYVASWWLRRKPFQRFKNSDTESVWVNERFALAILLQVLDHNPYDTKVYNRNKAIKAAQQAMYQIKYRNTKPKSLELFLVGMNATL